MAEREAQLILVAGSKGSGKTYETIKNLIVPTLRGNQNTGAHPRKVLILDVNNEFGNVQADHKNPNFPHVKSLALKDLPAWNRHPAAEARRVSVMKHGGGKRNVKELQDTLDYCLKNFMNGLFLIEDPNKYISDNLPNDLIGSITTQRHMAVDIVMHFQTIGKVAIPKLWGNSTYFRLHKTTDKVKKSEKKFEGDIEHMSIMEKMIQIEAENGNPRACYFLETQTGKVKGNYTDEQFTKGIERFLQDNPKMVKTEVERTYLYTGEKVHDTRKEAVLSLIEEYKEKYYGNPR